MQAAALSGQGGFPGFLSLEFVSVDADVGVHSSCI